MSRLSRFLPKFLRGDKTTNQKTGDKYQCKIIFLDDTEYFIPYKGGLKGQHVLDRAFDQLNLFERDYFGLRFIDTTGQTHWLDCLKTLSSQLKGCTVPYTFYFGVKFYPADPCKLKEEITRYQFFLQVKQDILHGRLPVTFEEAVELFAYAVQSELGDYESQELPPGYVSEFQFVPNQTQELEEQVAMLHRRAGGMVPATAELKFLDKVKWLDMYGVDLHPVSGEGNTEYFLGLTPTGIVVYKNKTKVGNYFWPRITKVNFKGKVFIIRVKDKINDEHTYAFELATKAACKHLWKCCVEHHTFFRLSQLGAASSRDSKPYRSTAKHRNSGRQDRQNNVEQSGREQPRVLRVQSRRQARRAMSDPRLNQGDGMTGIQYSEGHVTMVVTPEQVKGSRHRSLPDLKGRESPTSTRSAPWETNMDTGLYTSGRESPVSVTQSENVNYLRRHRESDSESGHRKKHVYRQGYDSDGGARNKLQQSYGYYSLTQRSGYDSETRSSTHCSIRRRKYFPSSRKGSDNESDVSFSRRRRRELDSGSESDVSPKYTARERKAKSVGPDQFEKEWQAAMHSMYLQDKENRPNGSIPSVHSAPLGEARQKKMRRRRSKSPGNSKRPPEELRQHIEFELLDPSEDMTEDQLREIPYVNVETKAEPFKVKYSPSNRRRYRSPKRKSMGDIDPAVKGGFTSEDPPASTRTPERTPEPAHRQLAKPTGGGYYSDTGSVSRRDPSNTPYTQQYNNNTLPSHSKHFTADIRSIPQFHENHLFYAPYTSPRFQLPQTPTHASRVPGRAPNRYQPPPYAVFKPIDAIEDKNSSVDHRRMNSTSDSKGHDLKGQDDNHDLKGQGDTEGEGQEVDMLDNRTGEGLNNSQGSNSTLTNTPPRGTAQHRFGTQDAIARLYSSPAQKHNPLGNQSNVPSSNQNTSYNSQSNQNMSYNSQFNQNMPSNRNYRQPANHNPPYSPKVNDRSYSNNPQTVTGYDNNSNALKSVNSNYTKPTGVPYPKEPQRTYQYPEGRNNITVPPRQPIENGVVNHSGTQGGMQFSTSKMFYTQSDNFTNVNPVENKMSQNSSYSSDSAFAINPHLHSNSKQSLPRTSGNPQNSFYTQSNAQNYSSQNHSSGIDRLVVHSSQENRSSNQSSPEKRNQTTSEGRLGLQPQWQYVGQSRRPETRRSENTGHGAKNAQGNMSTRSPASSPSKSGSRHIEMSPGKGSRNQSSSNIITAGTPPSKSVLTNQSNSYQMNSGTPPSKKFSTNQNGSNYTPTYLSPDSAISSGVSSHKNSPQKMTNSANQSPYADRGSENYSRTRTPAFGRSDVWTEL